MKLYTEEHGEWPPLLLLTGLGYAIWSWRRQLPEWSQRFRSPALVVHGDADRVVPYENGVELARRIPGSRFETFPWAGHLLFVEDAPRFNAMVASFLTG